MAQEGENIGRSGARKLMWSATSSLCNPLLAPCCCYSSHSALSVRQWVTEWDGSVGVAKRTQMFLSATPFACFSSAPGELSTGCREYLLHNGAPASPPRGATRLICALQWVPWSQLEWSGTGCISHGAALSSAHRCWYSAAQNVSLRHYRCKQSISISVVFNLRKRLKCFT